MPIKKTSKGGYKFGNSGHEYPTKAGAVNQMKAMYTAGYKGEGEGSVKKKKKKPKK